MDWANPSFKRQRLAWLVAFVILAVATAYSFYTVSNEAHNRTADIREATRQAFVDGCERGNELRQAMTRTVLIFVPRDHPRVKNNPQALAALDKALDQFKPVNCSKVGPKD